MECRDRNGRITGYSVRYGEEGGGDLLRDFRGGMTTIISGLTKQTVYIVKVAARTSVGTGVYSDPQTIMTPDSEYYPFAVDLFIMLCVVLLCRCLPQSEW